MAIRALMMDVDGVLITGRPQDGRHWQATLYEDVGVSAESLRSEFFVPHWEEIVLGRVPLLTHLEPALQRMGSTVSAEEFLAYWFAHDSRVNRELLDEIATLHSRGVAVYLATNQEHLRAAYLMNELCLTDYVDGIFYSAQLGAKKPDEAFFRKIQASVSLCADEMLLVDDSVDNVEAARACGWKALHRPAKVLQATLSIASFIDAGCQ